MWQETANPPSEEFIKSPPSSACPEPETEKSTSARHQSKRVKKASLKRPRDHEPKGTDSSRLHSSTVKRRASSPTAKKRRRKSSDQNSLKRSVKQSDEKPKRLKSFIVQPLKTTPPSRVVSDSNGGLLKITFQRGQ